MDTFASEIGREACLIDRLTLSLREPDVYALKYRMIVRCPCIFYDTPTNVKCRIIIHAFPSHLRKLLRVSNWRRKVIQRFVSSRSDYVSSCTTAREESVAGDPYGSYGVSTSFAKAFSSFHI